MKIIQARTKNEIDPVRMLFREYEAYLNVDLCFQQFESELSNLPGKYAPPFGTLLLAKDRQKAIGCGALRRLCTTQDRTCEMKRLYVCPEERGKGIGRQIATRLIQEGARLGYCSMVLDTLSKLDAAIHLYESLGFVRTGPYYDNPLPEVVYLKLDLRAQLAPATDCQGLGIKTKPYIREKMTICTKCKESFRDEDMKNLHGKILCEDCYIDEVVPKMPKAHYDNDSEFMNRLKDSYSVRKQQYH